jgi:hypothetical protein
MRALRALVISGDQQVDVDQMSAHLGGGRGVYSGSDGIGAHGCVTCPSGQLGKLRRVAGRLAECEQQINRKPQRLPEVTLAWRSFVRGRDGASERFHGGLVRPFDFGRESERTLTDRVGLS